MYTMNVVQTFNFAKILEKAVYPFLPKLVPYIHKNQMFNN